MPQFPAGTVTFLFTDIEQSTKGWESDAAAARVVVERHLALIRQHVESPRWGSLQDRRRRDAISLRHSATGSGGGAPRAARTAR